MRRRVQTVDWSCNVVLQSSAVIFLLLSFSSCCVWYLVSVTTKLGFLPSLNGKWPRPVAVRVRAADRVGAPPVCPHWARWTTSCSGNNRCHLSFPRWSSCSYLSLCEMSITFSILGESFQVVLSLLDWSMASGGFPEASREASWLLKRKDKPYFQTPSLL